MCEGEWCCPGDFDTTAVKVENGKQLGIDVVVRDGRALCARDDAIDTDRSYA